jgi:hypothetical protein
MSAGDTVIMAVAILAALAALEVVVYTMNHVSNKSSGRHGQAPVRRRHESGLRHPADSPRR